MAKKDNILKFKSKQTLGQKIGGFLQSFDLFGRSIVFAYNGDDSFKTIYGGVISIGILCMVCNYLGILFNTLITRKEVNTTKKKLRKNDFSVS
jgi:hypothetical protein